MDNDNEIECLVCGWQGTYNELICSDEDFESDKPHEEIAFNLCPLCESDHIAEVD